MPQSRAVILEKSFLYQRLPRISNGFFQNDITPVSRYLRRERFEKNFADHFVSHRFMLRRRARLFLGAE
jgi:hypothetical protein